ncbi:MAG TPA: hypothetical protein VF177_17220 [Anaerolineae bacterium]
MPQSIHPAHAALQIFLDVCKTQNIAFDKKSFLHLLHTWYREPNRVMQSVHPRDIIQTVIAICDYENVPAQLTPELIDEACARYSVDGDMASSMEQQYRSNLNGANGVHKTTPQMAMA